MSAHKKRFSLLALVAVMAIGIGAAVAVAAGDTDDNITPASTAFTITNSGNTTFAVGSATVTCTTSSAAGTTPASGLGPITFSTRPTWSGCTNNFGGAATVTTSGSWTLTFVDSANETENPDSAEPNSGDSLTLGIPKGGAVITTAGCTITVGPSAATSATASYDDQTTGTFTNQVVPVSVSGAFCAISGTQGTFNGTYVSNTTISDAS